MKVIIIDDEKRARQLLQAILNEKFTDIEVVDDCEDLPSGIKSIKKHKPNLVFLDIEMPGFSGLQLLDFFNEDEIDFSIIFVTAYSEFAIQSFKLSAIDYILKPINVDALSEAIERYRKIETRQQLLLDGLRSNLIASNEKKIALPSRDSVTYISPSDILYIKADGAYSNFYLNNKVRHTLSRNLKYVEEMIVEFTYLKRCHKSFIVNTNAIAVHNHSLGVVVLNDGSEVAVSEDRVSEILR